MTVKLDDEAVEALRVDVPSLQACYQCGDCTAVCPWAARVPGFSPRRVMRALQVGSGYLEAELWRCTACAACTVACPRGLNPPSVIATARRRALLAQNLPAGVQRALESMADRGNPFGTGASSRGRWAEGLGVLDHGQFPVLLFAGCTASFDPRAHGALRTLARALQVSKTKFGLLGRRETCCGNEALAMGEVGLFEELARENIRAIEESGATTVVAASPHCYNALKNEYPRLGLAGVEVLHYTEMLARLLSEHKLATPGKIARRVAYHDPCYLGRVNRVFDAPRAVLEGAGAKLIELESNRDGAVCCGGGGGGAFREVPLSERLSVARVKEAADAGAEVLATACPVCVQMFEDALAVTGLQGTLEVRDTSELVSRAMGVTVRH